jgi:hypothetical protein
VSGNTALDNGGGVWEKGKLLSINNSTVANNTALISGGGVFAGAGSSNTIVPANSTFSGNRAGSVGGGLFLATTGPAATSISPPNGSILANVTISGNYSQNCGGGIAFEGSGLALIDDTIAFNVAAFGGGLGVPPGTGGTVQVGNMIIALNVSSNGVLGGYDVHAGTEVTDLGGNLIGVKDGSTFAAGKPNAAGSYVGLLGAELDPRLGPLAFNGGPTPTRALLSGSLAAGHGLKTLNGGFGISTDQRGVPPSTTKPDIGAFDPPARRAGASRAARAVDFFCVDVPPWAWLAG